MTTPYDQEAEESVLGAMLLDIRAVDQVAKTLVSSDFYLPSHQALFMTLLKLREDGNAVDAVTARDAMKANGLLDAFGDQSKLVALQSAVPSIANVAHYAEIVIDHSMRRRMMAEGAALIDRAQDPTQDVHELLDVHRMAIADLDRAALSGEMDDWSVEDFIEAHKTTDPLTKWVVHGLIRRQHKLMVVAGESHGKSVLLRYIAICAAYGIQPFRHTKQRKVNTLIIDAENPADAMTETFELILKTVVKESPQDQVVNRLWWRPEGLDLRSRGDVAAFENVLQARRPDLVCIGPMYTLFEMGLTEHWERPARQLQRTLKELMVRYDFALMIEDHPPQADSSGKRPLRPYGSSFWRRWLDMGIGMEPINEDATAFRLDRWKSRVDTDWPKYIQRGSNVGSKWPFEARWGDDDRF